MPYTQNLLYPKFKIEYASIINCQSSNCWVYTHILKKKKRFIMA